MAILFIAIREKRQSCSLGRNITTYVQIIERTSIEFMLHRCSCQSFRNNHVTLLLYSCMIILICTRITNLYIINLYYMYANPCFWKIAVSRCIRITVSGHPFKHKAVAVP
jgi:hypothetical protein